MSKLADIGKITVNSVKVHTANGKLTVFENQRTVPFDVKRVYVVSDVPAGTWRGDHAHKQCNQALVCVQGRVEVACDDGEAKKEFCIESPAQLLYVPAGIWGKEKYCTPNTVLLVLTDRLYEESDYIRDYEAFRRFRGIAR